MKLNKFFNLIKATLNDKSLQRILVNWEVAKQCSGLTGVMIDLGCGGKPSYRNYWDIRPSQFIRVDLNPLVKPDIIADFNQLLPFPENFSDVIFLFSVLYIIEQPEELLKEIFRVLKPNGSLFLFAPLIFNESLEPDDLFRFTSSSLKGLISKAGFRQYQIVPIGERFSAALHLVDKIFVFNICKIVPRLIALALDKLYPARLKRIHPCPMGYFVKAVKG